MWSNWSLNFYWRAIAGAPVEGEIVSGTYRSEGCDVLHQFWNQANNDINDFSEGFCEHPNVRRSLSYVMKWLLQGPATKERFAEKRLNDHPWAQIHDEEYHLVFINYPIDCKFTSEEDLFGRSFCVGINFCVTQRGTSFNDSSVSSARVDLLVGSFSTGMSFCLLIWLGRI